jgi:hypothetical protein
MEIEMFAMKSLTAVAVFFASAGVALAGLPAPTPAPLIGAVGGPAGMLAAAVCYGGYRLYKAKFGAK